MRMLLSVERIVDYLHKLNHALYNEFAWDFLTLEATQTLLSPLCDSLSRFSSALLATILQVIQKLNPEFYQNLDADSLRIQFFSKIISGLKLPSFFETMHEDEIYNKQTYKESISKAKIFVPQAEKLWQILACTLATAPAFPKDLLPDTCLLVGEYTAQYPCSWSSESIIKSISEIKKVFSVPPSTPSIVLGEHILKIFSIALKQKGMICSIGAGWCLRQVEYPNLSLHPIIIQFCLNTLESSEFKMKETGFLTLSHVVQNVNAVELAQFQREIYAILVPYVTSVELQILTLALPLMLQFLHKCKKIKPIPQSSIESLFSSFLLGINNTNSAISTTYIRNFPPLLDLAGVHVVTYAGTLFPYLESALSLTSVETLDKASLQDLLLVLKSLVANGWPRVPAYKYQIFKAGMSGVVGKGEKCEESIIAIVSDIIGMLRSCCGDEFREIEPLIEEIKTMYPIANKITLT